MLNFGCWILDETYEWLIAYKQSFPINQTFTIQNLTLVVYEGLRNVWEI